MIWGDSTPMSLAPVSGFQTYEACTMTGDAWKKTKVELDRDYVCLPAKEK
jgi:hypothetical protein